ncbi:MAG: SAM-dependent methyltransferase [Gammaproteobacteria bacterium]
MMSAEFISSQSSLPVPEQAAISHSEKLIKFIKNKIDQKPEGISFAEFMEYVLYAPGLGYYSAGSRKLGKEGDFITAPEISSLFSYCLANSIQPAVSQYGRILEVGAGSGKMATDILMHLEKNGSLPEQYFILERSAELRERQRRSLQQRCKHLFKKVSWIDEFPSSFQGIVVANELLDALPIHRVIKQDGKWMEQTVQWQGDKFAWGTAALSSPRLQQRLEQIESRQGDLPESYQTEINLAAEDWIASLAEQIDEGYVLLVDYGYSQHEYYHPQREQGSLLCHYRHQAHNDPFVYPGLQDITAHVDFTAMADSALNAGLKVSGFTTQMLFLMDSGLNELAESMSSEDAEQQLQLASQIRRLTLPQEMGESFKVMLFSKNVENSLRGFAMDMRNRL